jgi:hypothetical protein
MTEYKQTTKLSSHFTSSHFVSAIWRLDDGVDLVGVCAMFRRSRILKGWNSLRSEWNYFLLLHGTHTKSGEREKKERERRRERRKSAQHTETPKITGERV